METSKLLILLAALRSVTTDNTPTPLYSHRYGDKNQYFCHCANDNNCDKKNGYCSSTGGKCSNGWFGPSCQSMALDFEGGDTAWVTDQNCNHNPGSSLSVNLKAVQVVSFVRLKFKNTDPKHLDLKLNYTLVNGVDQPCPSGEWKTDVLNRADIFCPSSCQIRSVTLKGSDLRKLCNIYVARGRIVGLGAATTESSFYDLGTNRWTGDYVVDGTLDKGDDVSVATGCFHTGSNDPSPYVQVTLDPPEDVFSFRIYNRKASDLRKRILGFKLETKNALGERTFTYTDNTDSRASEDSIYLFDVYPPNILKKTKTIRAELPSTRTFTICELLIFGGVCPTNKYGTNCNQKCGLCRDEQCNPFLGVCLNRSSKPGLISSWCSECQKPGITGPKCDQECPSGTYGLGCAEKCPTACIKKKCAPINGTCLEGCVSGYTGEKCEKPCPQGRYGLNCARECDTCKGPKCTSKEGECNEGCIPGYFGEKCEHECTKGYYGLDCNFTCELCADMECNNVNGTCNMGCKGGRSGSFCTICPPEFYGSNCSQPCGMCKGNIRCDNDVGTCASGCLPGYLGSLCDEACPNKTYGDQCGKQCGMCAENTTCDNVNGTCAEGCREGYIEPFCDACPNKTYGDQCGQQCGMCAENITCDNVNGTCAEGCRKGYIEPFCDAEALKSGSKYAAKLIYILPLAILLALLAYLASRNRTPLQGAAPNAEVEAETEAEEKSSVGDGNKNPSDKQIQEEEQSDEAPDSPVISSGERGSK